MVQRWSVVVVGVLLLGLPCRASGSDGEEPTTPSQARAESETYQQASETYHRHHHPHDRGPHDRGDRAARFAPPALRVFDLAQMPDEPSPDEPSPDAPSPDADPSAQQAAVPFDELRVGDAPDWSALPGGLPGLVQAFGRARDERFLKLPEMPDFTRRSSWLYPDDGCFARGALASQNLAAWGYPRPAKLFAFGGLRAKTPNTASGYVNWWYHVAPAVRFEGELYVIDPALEPRHPLKALEWATRMSDSVSIESGSVGFALCGTYAYEPGSSCRHSSSGAEAYARQHQADYLRYEWDRVTQLGRQPKVELGDRPPWTQPESDDNYLAYPEYGAPSGVTPQYPPEPSPMSP